MQAHILKGSASAPVYRGRVQPRVYVARPSSSSRRLCRAPTVSKPLVSCRAAPESYASKASLDLDDVLDSVNLDGCPHGFVEGLMRTSESGVLSAKPTEKLESLIPRLNKVSGLPVLDADGKVVGVISRKDIIRVRKAAGNLREKVEEHMTKPAITIKAGTPVRKAADLMLKKKIRRLPVVDSDGKPLGILSRTDIFKPLMEGALDEYNSKEVAAMATGVGVRQTWTIKYLYDGDCAMCRSLKAVLQRQDGRQGRIAFIDIADLNYDPVQNMGIEYEDAMETIHAILPDGKVLLGTDALRALFDTVGLGWAVRLSEIPLFAKIMDVVYDFLSANRLSLGAAFDGVIAAKRIDLSKKGVETCGDVDEECSVDW